tara:strand:+ start:39 stop:290 length:252 start_codon:yes stop_codon:yes gene_type:complete
MTDQIKNETIEEEVKASAEEATEEVATSTEEVEEKDEHEVLGYPERVPNCHKGSNYKHSYVMLWFILVFIIFSILVSFLTNPL